MFCAFIDFEKAFATDWREGLWCKLLMNNINGKMHNVIPLVNMYHNVKSRIMYNNEYSHFFYLWERGQTKRNLISFPIFFILK